jgi:hypothetical protein
MNSRKPYQQGDLDGYCGPYCVINAHQYIVGPIYREHAWAYLSELMDHLNQKRPIKNRLLYGSSINEIGMLFWKMEADYSLHRSMPYRRSRPTLAEFFLGLEQFLKVPNRLALICLEHKHNHWTLVRKITAGRLLLFDSDGLKHVDKARCSMIWEVDKTVHKINASLTYFLQRGDEDA